MRRCYCAWCFDNQTSSRSGPRLIVVLQARWWLQARAFAHWIVCGSARNSRTLNWPCGGKRCWRESILSNSSRLTRPCWSAPLISCRQSLERFTQFTLPESCSGARVPAKIIATNGVDLNEPARSEANDDFAAKSALAKRLKGEERNGQPT